MSNGGSGGGGMSMTLSQSPWSRRKNSISPGRKNVSTTFIVALQHGHCSGSVPFRDAVRAKPYSVVLFDEAEKAHPRILDLFLQVFDEGTLTDSRGRKASFRETVIILTSNLGSAAPAGKKMGFGISPAGEDAVEALHSRIADAVRRHLRPELSNRISRTVVFNPLNKENVREIAEKFIARLNARLSEHGLRLTVDESVYALLMKEGYSPEFGARAMERAVEVLIAQPLAKVIIAGRGGQRGGMIARAAGTRLRRSRDRSTRMEGWGRDSRSIRSEASLHGRWHGLGLSCSSPQLSCARFPRLIRTSRLASFKLAKLRRSRHPPR